MTPPKRDLTGQRFSRLLVQSFAGRVGSKPHWRCVCDCGNTHTAVGHDLERGATPSCGCLREETRSAKAIKHGARRKGQAWPEWGVWQQMIGRCHRPKNNSFSYYGGRGITVCDRWRFGEDGLGGFECFIADLGRRPGPDFQIDRTDNEGPYAPTNCRWVTRSQQNRNRRPWGSCRPDNDNHSQDEAA